jgi:hypothetical protein
MSMYEYLKDLLPVAELVGEPKEITCYSGDKIMGDQVSIEGFTDDGLEYHLTLKLKEAKPDVQ